MVVPINLRNVSWGEVDALCVKVAERVQGSGFKPDLIVTLGRGGWVPARILSDLLANQNVVSLGMKFYAGIGKTFDEPFITQALPPGVLVDKRVLLIDDLVDTGASITRARKELWEATEIRVASMHVKPRASFRPDFFGEETADWIVYPWERNETGRELAKAGKAFKASG